MTPPGFVTTASLFLHTLAERWQSPKQCRASEAVDRLNATSERVIAEGSDPLRDAIDNMAENR